MIIESEKKKMVIKLIVWFGIAIIVGGTVGLLTSPGDYPWALKVIFALCFLVLFSHQTIVKNQKRQPEASKKNPEKIREDFENDFQISAKQIEEIKSDELGGANIQATSVEPKPLDTLEIDKSYFENNYEIVFYSGTEGQKGNLVFDETTTISLSGIENDICLRLFNALEESWSQSLPRDIGWVSYDDFRESVAVWKKKIWQHKDEDLPVATVTDLTIIKAISRINREIRKKLGLDDNLNLIENGDPFSRTKHYRFRINLGHIDVKK